MFVFIFVVLLLSVVMVKGKDFDNFSEEINRGFTYDYVLKEIKKLPDVKILSISRKEIKVLDQSYKREPKIEKYMFNSKGLLFATSSINLGDRWTREDYDDYVKELIEPELPDDFFQISDEKLLLYSDENSVYIYPYIKNNEDTFIVGAIYYEIGKVMELIFISPKLIDNECSELYIYMKKKVMEFLAKKRKADFKSQKKPRASKPQS